MAKLRKSKSVLLERLFDEAPAANGNRISAPQAERQGLYPDWPTWPLGAELTGTWEWLLEQVECGAFPDMPCRWSDQVGAGRSPVYWLDVEAKTRHVVVGYGRFVLTHPVSNESAPHGLLS